METLDAIRGRKSTRAFLSRPVPKEIVAKVLDAARWAPSGGNKQQWRVTVASGAKVRELEDRLHDMSRTLEPRSLLPTQVESDPGRRRGALMGDLGAIAEKLEQSLWEFIGVGSYCLYDAPAVVVVSAPGKGSGDIVQFVTTMLLAAHDLGLGTCWLGYPLAYRPLFHELLEIPEEETIGAVVAVGYPDPDSPANAYRSPRDDLERFVRWVGFE